MKVEELMVGNLIEIKGVVKRVKPSHINELYQWQRNNLKQYREFKPIPLTEDWVKRIPEFKEIIDKGNYQMENDFFNLNYCDNEFILCIGEYCELGKAIQFEYVHDFQNWYYWAYEKTELNIKK